MSARAAFAIACLAAAAGALDAAPPDPAEPSTRTALITFADGNTLPLRNWTLSYDYIASPRGKSIAFAPAAQRPAGALWLGKRVVPVEDAVLAIGHAELRRETLVDGRPQAIVSSTARDLTVTMRDGKTIKAKVEPPHRDLLAPGADKSTTVMARSLDLRGESITGTRREVCLLSYSSLVECGGTPADQVVKIQFQR